MNPKLKKFLKRANRGVILAIISAVILTTYIIIDETQFKSNVEPLTQLVQDYFEDLSAIAVTPEKYIDKEKHTTTTEGLDDFANKYSEVLNKYMVSHTEPSSNRRWGTKADIHMESDSCKEFNSGYVMDWSYKINKITVSKSGPGMAMITLSYNLTVDVAGECPYFIMAQRLVQSYGYYDEKNMNNESANARRLTVEVFDCTIRAKKSGGEWKFYIIENSGYGWDETPIGGDDDGSDI